MARTGRPPKPTALKRIQGTLRKHRERKVNEWHPPAGAPPMPEGLDAVAQAEWRSAVELAVGPGVITTADGRILESYCRAVSRARAADAVVAKEGLTVESPNGLKAHPAVAIARREWDAAARLGERLGLDPSSRARLSVPQKPQGDPSEDFLFKTARLQVLKGGADD